VAKNGDGPMPRLRQVVCPSSAAISLVAGGLLGLAYLATAQETPTFPSETSVITVDAVVVDKKGEPVTDLQRSDFTVTEDGVPQAITAFEMRNLPRGVAGAAPAARPQRVTTNQGAASSEGRLLAFVVDDESLSPTQGISAVKAALKGWLDKSSDPRDEVTLVTTSGDVWWSTQVGQGKADLLAIVDRITAKRPTPIPAEYMTDWEAAQIAVYSSPGGCKGTPGDAFCRVVKRWIDSLACAQECEWVVQRQAEILYDRIQRQQRATLETVARLSDGWAQRRGRKAIFVFSAGFIETPQRDLDKAAVSASQRGNTAVYYVDVRGLLTDHLNSAERASRLGPPAPADTAAMMLDDVSFAVAGGESLADATGGFAVVNTNDVLPGLTRGTEESGHYYLLGYPSPHPHDGRWHDLKVEVHRSGVKVRARKGYLASPEGAPLPATQSQPDRDSGHLLDPALVVGTLQDRIPLRLTARAIASGTEGTRILVGIDVDTAALTFAEDDRGQQAAVDVTVLAVSRDHPKVSPVHQRVALRSLDGAARSWWATAQEATLPAGPAQIKVLVRDVTSGLEGTVAQRLDVPAKVEAAPDELSQSVGLFLFGTHEGQRDAQVMEEATPLLSSSGPECHLAVRGRIENRAGKTVEEWVHQWPPAPLDADAPVPLEYRRTSSLTQGEYLLESDLIDVATGAVSVRYEPFAVPAPSDLALSSLVLVGGGAPVDDGTSASDDPFVVGLVRFRPLLSRRLVRGTSQLPLLARVYSSAAVPVELTLTIMRDEKTLTTLPVSPPAADAEGRVAWLGTLPLASLPIGDYELLLRARGGSDAAEARTSFEVVAPPTSEPKSVETGRPAEQGATPAVNDPELAAVLAKAGQYVVDYGKAFRDVVAEEVYEQRYDPPNRRAAQGRVTHADVVFATLGGPFLWGTFRDVRTVDGHEVHEDMGRLEKLFERGDRAAMEEARAIRAESARYNIGVARTINEPTIPLMFLHPQNQGRFRFKIKGHRRVGKREAVEVAYREIRRPTMISDSQGRALPADGCFWIDPGDGTVLRSEIELDSPPHLTRSGVPVQSSAHITVEYREEPDLSIFVPDTMTESYGPTYARATYSHYRRFTVTTHEAIGLPPGE
jgi:VWFA-related protein